MRVLLAFDKFKDALTAHAACTVAADALRARHPDWTLDLCPLTDGGEGFTETLSAHVGARVEPLTVSGPLSTPLVAPLGFVSATTLTPSARTRLAAPATGTLAIAGLASASGFEHVPPARRDPWHTTTLGTGELLRHAAKNQADLILLGIGGSATNDLGCGALAALGFRFLDADGQTIAVPTPATWSKIVRIDRSAAIALPPLAIACDVTNPLLGPRGATTTFGPQKGLRPEDLPRLETEAARMAALLCAACDQPTSLTATPGTGAAGGISFGLMVAYGARLVSGYELVSDWLDLPARLAAADLVITGEGRFDATSLGGKGPGSILAEARRLGKVAHVFAGSLGVPTAPGLHAITPAGVALPEALRRARELLATAVSTAF